MRRRRAVGKSTGARHASGVGRSERGWYTLHVFVHLPALAVVEDTAVAEDTAAGRHLGVGRGRAGGVN